MRAFCIAASCCTWRMSAVLGSFRPESPNESISMYVRCRNVEVRGIRCELIRVSYLFASEKVVDVKSVGIISGVKHHRGVVDPCHARGEATHHLATGHLETSVQCRRPVQFLYSCSCHPRSQLSSTLYTTPAFFHSSRHSRLVAALAWKLVSAEVVPPWYSQDNGRTGACWRGAGRARWHDLVV
jgi:hypothetical protein